MPFWRQVGGILKPRSVRIFNISVGRMTMSETPHEPWLSAELYDGIRLPVGDRTADIAMCHSVFGYIMPSDRDQLAGEIKRAGRRFILQTPAYEFPIELSSGVPFLHWLPRWLGRKLVIISPRRYLMGTNVRRYFDHTWLLTKQELSSYFPTAEIHTEYFLGFPKSYIAIGSS